MTILESGAFAAAGALLAITEGIPAQLDSAGFDALTFTEIDGVLDLGSSGGKRNYNLIDVPLLNRRETEQVKGSFTQGVRAMVFVPNNQDAGQVLLEEANQSDNRYSFRITFNSGDIHYFIARNTGGDDNNGTVDNLVAFTTSLAQTCDTIRVAPTGLLTVSVTTPGLFTVITDAIVAAIQTATSGTGQGAEFDVELIAGVVDNVNLIRKNGFDYAVGDTIDLILTGPTETTTAVLTVDSIAPEL